MRDHLVAAAAALIAERGSAGVTVRDIARAAGVADGALYNHFADRDELLALALRDHVQRVMAAARALPAPGTGSVAENLEAFVRSSVATLTKLTPVFAGFLDRPGVLQRFHVDFDPATTPESLPGALADYLRGEQELGRVAADADVTAAATLLIGACHDRVLPFVFQQGTAVPRLPRALVTSLVATVLHGIAPD